MKPLEKAITRVREDKAWADAIKKWAEAHWIGDIPVSELTTVELLAVVKVLLERRR